MKKIIIALLITLSFCSCKRETYNDIAKTDFAAEMFVGKWAVSYVDAGFSNKVGDLFLFNSDGTFSIIFSNYTQQGTWALKENILVCNSIFYNYKSSTPSSFNVEKINSKELILNTNNYRIKFIKN